MRLRLLAVAAGLLAAPLVAAEPVAQVELDVTLVSGPPKMFEQAGIKEYLPKSTEYLPNSIATIAAPEHPTRVGVLSQSDACRLILACRENGHAKLLAEPKVVTHSGRPAHFLSGGRQAVLTGPSGPDGPTVSYHDVDTEVDFLPTVKKDGRIYLEVSPTLRNVNPGRGTQTAFGFVPGFDEISMRFAAEMGAGESAIFCFRDVSQTLLIVASPKIISGPKSAAIPEQSPVEQRAAKSAAKLVRKYGEACASGEPEKARRYARQALDLDPACFGAAAVPPAAPMATSLPPAPTQHAKRSQDDLHTAMAPPATAARPGPRCQDHPSEEDVLRALADSGNIKFTTTEIDIVCEKLVDKLDEPRVFPLVGPAQLHHCHWKCTVYMTDTAAAQLKRRRIEVVYIDKDNLHPCAAQPAPNGIQ